MLTTGHSARAVARRFGISPTTAAKMAKALARRPRTASVAPRPTTTCPAMSTRPEGSGGAASTDSADLLAADLETRLLLRNGLAADFRASVEPRERAGLAAALTSTLDGIRKVLVTAADQDEHDDEADAFDTYMMRIFQKARVVVAANQERVATPDLAQEALQ